MTTPLMPQLGEIIPDGAIDIFPENYGAALLSDDGSRRIVQGVSFKSTTLCHTLS